ncbi:MAG: NUDIX domain-containing protein [Patescibacteria group bacterium]|nr:NUDIX domain-containing protein [Patescibacteria group bacterium]
MEKEKRIGVGFGVLFLRAGKVLLGRRHSDPRKAGSALHGEGQWCMPGGKLDFGESLENGAKREVKEETGVELLAVEPMCINNDRAEDAHFITFGMKALEWKGEPQVLEPDTMTEWRWFPLAELPAPLYFPTKKILENFRSGKFYLPNQ